MAHRQPDSGSPESEKCTQLTHVLNASPLFALLPSYLRLQGVVGSLRPPPPLLRPSMDAEVSHLDWVRLYSLGSDWPQVLVHLLTGEAVKLDSKFTLEFDGDLAFLQPQNDPQAEPIWANSLFDLSAHSTSEEGALDELYVWSKSAKVQTNMKEFQCSMQQQALVHNCREAKFLAELYVHKVPKDTVMLRRFWATPRVQAMVFPESSDSKWACRNFDRFVGILRFPAEI